ncbi:MAG: S-adenosylmethionine decarboxylase [Glaciecola sp.]|jgi:S-adenosylmethionine decarboxylase
MNNLHTGSTADSLMIREGKSFAGMHIIVDLYGADYLDNIERVEAVMRECIEKCGAHLLHIHLHHFTPNDGVTGVAVLSESHISVHTWPERNFAAFDIFMCGDSKPELAIEILKDQFNAKKVVTTIKKRGEHLT